MFSENVSLDHTNLLLENSIRNKESQCVAAAKHLCERKINEHFWEIVVNTR